MGASEVIFRRLSNRSIAVLFTEDQLNISILLNTTYRTYNYLLFVLIVL